MLFNLKNKKVENHIYFKYDFSENSYLTICFFHKPEITETILLYFLFQAFRKSIPYVLPIFLD